jgi:hypothetical protein
MPLASFINSTQDLAILNVICSHAGIIAAPAIYTDAFYVYKKLLFLV